MKNLKGIVLNVLGLILLFTLASQDIFSSNMSTMLGLILTATTTFTFFKVKEEKACKNKNSMLY